MLHFFRQTLQHLYEPAELEEVIFLVFNKYAQFSKTDLLMRQNENLNQSTLIVIYDACKALQENMPVQYVLNEAWFYDRVFEVNASVLIPRPETEELVELILKSVSAPHQVVLDIGTGSGCIAIILAALGQHWQVSSIDVSKAALLLAARNAERYHQHIACLEMDVLDTAATQSLSTYDVVVSNPPYIKETEANAMHERVKTKEPHVALFVNHADASIFYKRIIDLCRTKLNANGFLFFELNPLTALDVKLYAQASHLFKTIELLTDLSGHCRFFKAQRL